LVRVDPPALDPFAIQTNPHLYVPRRATEEVLDELDRGLATSPSGLLCFIGPPGIGKTLLLHVLAAERASLYRAVYVPYPKLPPGGLWAYIADDLRLGADCVPKQAVEHLLGELAAGSRRLLLQIDDASSLPADALRDLIETARRRPNLGVLLVHSEGESLAEPLSADVPVVRLERPMSRSESQAYVQARLAGCRAPQSLVDLFDTLTVARLHRESEGNPLRLHVLAARLVRGAETPPREVADPLVAGGHGEPLEPRPEPAPEVLAPEQEEREPEEAPAPLYGTRWRRGRERRSRLLWSGTGFCLGLVIGGLAVASSPWWSELRERAGPSASASVAAAPRSPPPPAPTPPAAEPAAPPTEGAAALPAHGPPEPTSVAEEPVAADEEIDIAAVAPPGSVSPPEVAGEPAEGEPARSVPALDEAPRDEAAPEERARSASARGHAPAPSRPVPRPPQFAEPPLSVAAGRLEIRSARPVLIEIDGLPYGSTPLTRASVRVPLGSHRVIAYHGSGRTASKTVYVGKAEVPIIIP
jgi:type II secretory pathway predicted ATPase ExeA